MRHSQPPTPVAMDNTAANIIVNRTAKQKISKEIYMRFYGVRKKIHNNSFHILWEEIKKNLSYYVTKHHPIWDNKNYDTKILETKKKGIET